MRLHKTTLVIWTDFDPSDLSLEELGREADQGAGYCSHATAEWVDGLAKDEHVTDGLLEFFQVRDEERG